MSLKNLERFEDHGGCGHHLESSENEYERLESKGFKSRIVFKPPFRDGCNWHLVCRRSALFFRRIDTCASLCRHKNRTNDFSDGL